MIIQDKAYPVSAEKSSTWAYYGAIFIVLVGSSVLLLYNMLPKGSIERALKGVCLVCSVCDLCVCTRV